MLTTPLPVEKPKRRKAFWTKQFYLWHWVSSAICLAATLFFALTELTLNHAGDLKGKAKIVEENFHHRDLDKIFSLEVHGHGSSISSLLFATADAWATALFIAGANDGLRVAEDLQLAARFLIQSASCGKEF